ncbi:hypothetical protein A3Q56_00604 [Intoshia linei]|uniref:Uncharacterized protein n=1 Tax=Intoshia linei TaxID=1819745 RepID=A0A177BBQ1_9BILA|nr:hypothetical protein A3Q56_00604 [Intoshia linei]
MNISDEVDAAIVKLKTTNPNDIKTKVENEMECLILLIQNPRFIDSLKNILPY